MVCMMCTAALVLSVRYNAWNYTRLDSSGQFIRHHIPLGDVAVHYRGGSIIPVQPYANLTRIVRYTPVTLVVTIPAHPSGTAGAPLPPYANEEACAAVHAAHAGQFVSCGVMFMDTVDDTDITAGNSVEVRAGFSERTDAYALRSSLQPAQTARIEQGTRLPSCCYEGVTRLLHFSNQCNQ